MVKELAAGKPGATRRKTTAKLVAALTTHMAIEEKLVCPLVAARIGLTMRRSRDGAWCRSGRSLCEPTQRVDEPSFGAAVAMVTAGIKHHLKEEETEMFPKLKGQSRSWRVVELRDRRGLEKRRSA